MNIKEHHLNEYKELAARKYEIETELKQINKRFKELRFIILTCDRIAEEQAAQNEKNEDT